MTNQENSIEGGPTTPFEGASVVEQTVYETAYYYGQKIIENGFLKDTIDSVISERENWKYLANHDQLTGLLNRYGLVENLKQKGDLSNFGCLVVDGTNVKAINDTFGHLVGDQAIVGVANVLTKSTREEDIIARVGGDEFVIFFSLDERDKKGKSPVEQLDSVKNRIKQSTEEFLKAKEDFAKAGLEIAVGGNLPTPEMTLEDMIQNAEEDMNAHKLEQHQRLGKYRTLS